MMWYWLSFCKTQIVRILTDLDCVFFYRKVFMKCFYVEGNICIIKVKYRRTHLHHKKQYITKNDKERNEYKTISDQKQVRKSQKSYNYLINTCQLQGMIYGHHQC